MCFSNLTLFHKNVFFSFCAKPADRTYKPSNTLTFVTIKTNNDFI